MSWFDTVPQFVLAAALLFVPGLAVGAAARLRGFRVVALAPGISVSVVAIAAIVAPFGGIRWSLPPVLVITAILAGLAFAASILVARKGAAVQPHDGGTLSRQDRAPRGRQETPRPPQCA